MAENTAIRNCVLPFPIYGEPYAVTFPIFDNDGDPVSGATGLDSEKSLNANTFADCTNEATEIATTSGIYFLNLTAAEMTADITTIRVQTTSTDAKTTILTLYPRKLPIIRSGNTQVGNSTTVTLDASASSIDNFYTGCVVSVSNTTNTNVRVITGYTGSTKVANVTPDFVLTANSTSPFTIYSPEGRMINDVNVTYVANAVADIATQTSLTGVNTTVNAISANVVAIKPQTDLIPGTQDGYTFAQTTLLMASVLIGKASGLDTSNAVFRALDDSQNRVSANVDSFGNRLEVTLDPSSP